MALKVAVAQFHCGLDKARNLQRAVDAVGEAGAAEAALVVLPEATMCGFGEPGIDLSPYAEPLDGTFVTDLCASARQARTTVVAGMFEVSPEPGKVFNTIVVVSPYGLVGAYRKVHLFDALGWRESDRVVAGTPGVDEPLVFEAADLTVGVMNCYDLRFPETARRLADAGASVIAEPANWVAGPGKTDVFVTLLRARAIENTCYVVAAAKPAPECAGHSMVVDPAGAVVAELGEEDGGFLTATLTAERVDEIRAVLPVLDNRRFTVVPR